MPPVVDVDLKSLQEEGEQSRHDDLRLPLAWRLREHHAQADEGGGSDEKDEQEAADPAIIGEGADIGIVRIEFEDEAEPQRSETAEVVEQHGDRPQLVAEPTRRAFVIVLRGDGSLIEELPRLGN